MGSADVPLMKALIDALGRTEHRYVVSTGPQHQEFELADNMTGAEFLPQVSVLPHVDAVITHGGNNTVTECMWFGKPMIVLPIFWDQHDNAQRVDKAGYGVPADLHVRRRPAGRRALAGAVGRDARGVRNRGTAAARVTRDHGRRGVDRAARIHRRAGHPRRLGPICGIDDEFS